MRLDAAKFDAVKFSLAIKNREVALLLFHSRRFACYQSA